MIRTVPRAAALVVLGGVLLFTTDAAAGQRGQQPPAPSATENGEFTIQPPYSTNNPDMIVDHRVPRGTIHRFVMKSEDSKIYKGISRDKPGAVVPYQRPVAVYVPAQYVPGTPAPFMVVQDGLFPKYHLTLPVALDNLIHQKKIPPVIAVMVHNGGGDGPGSQRGLEYDTVSDTYMRFIETEVLPRVEKDYKITLTKDPEGRATMGGSSGAACAFTMAWFHPELYRRVLSYSGTFVNQARPSTELAPRGAWEYHATFIPQSERKPIRVWLEVGELDNGATRDESTFGNWVIANQRMAAALKAKGYDYQYVYVEGARHTDVNVIFQTLPQALVWLWHGYPIK